MARKEVLRAEALSLSGESAVLQPFAMMPTGLAGQQATRAVRRGAQVVIIGAFDPDVARDEARSDLERYGLGTSTLAVPNDVDTACVRAALEKAEPSSQDVVLTSAGVPRSSLAYVADLARDRAIPHVHDATTDLSWTSWAKGGNQVLVTHSALALGATSQTAPVAAAAALALDRLAAVVSLGREGLLLATEGSIRLHNGPQGDSVCSPADGSAFTTAICVAVAASLAAGADITAAVKEALHSRPKGVSEAHRVT